MDKDLILYTPHRFVVYAAGGRIPFDRHALEVTPRESGIDSFGMLVDLDEKGRNAVGQRLLRNLRCDAEAAGQSAIPPSRLRLSAR